MELTGEQLKIAEFDLKTHLPQSVALCSYLAILNKSDIKSDLGKVFVNRWPDFSVIICKPEYEKKGDMFKVTLFFADNESNREEISKMFSVIDWKMRFCLGTTSHHNDIIKAVISEKEVPTNKFATCHIMMLEDVSCLPTVDSSGITLSTLDESHVTLVHEMWKFGMSEESARMIHNMITRFPSCCVLDAEANPVSWILTYDYGALGVLYTFPEHRGKGYAKVLISTMAKKFQAQGYPIFCFIEEENVVSYRLFKYMGFTADPSCRFTFLGIN